MHVQVDVKGKSKKDSLNCNATAAIELPPTIHHGKDFIAGYIST